MNLKTQKRIASIVLKVGKKRVIFDKEKLNEIKGAITKRDIRNLVGKGIIKARKEKGVSRFRARKTLVQQRKGRRKGPGSKRGTSYARLPRKRRWILAVRPQRKFIQELRDKGMLKSSDYRNLYKMIKGGAFRSRRHIKLYLEEHKLVQDVKKKKTRQNQL
nr:50S ribosomal protein L19e [Candidatus Woesearchaeota archaeon]